MNDEFYAKLNALTKDELEMYESVATGIKRFLDICGVLTLFAMLVFVNMFTIILGIILVYILGSMSINITTTLSHIQNRLFEISSKDK